MKFQTWTPYGVVYNTLVKGRDRIAQVSGYKAKVRPYLQDFTATWLKPATVKNVPGIDRSEQVRQQIKAVYDAGYEEWILWDPRNTYHEDAFEKETEEALAGISLYERSASDEARFQQDKRYSQLIQAQCEILKIKGLYFIIEQECPIL